MDPYQVLGVAPGTSLHDIKRAFKKKALRLHPDVNKAPEAKAQFMECKEAYQRLLSWSGQQRPGSPGAYTPPPSPDFWNWDLKGFVDMGSQQESYSLADVLRDIEREIAGFLDKRRQKKGSRGPPSFWDDLAGVGEEFVEFLESGLGLRGEEEAEAAEPRHETGGGEYGSSSRAEGGSDGTRRPGRQESAGGADVSPPASPTIEDELGVLKRKLGL